MEELNRADMDVELEIQMQTAVLHTHKEQQEVRAKNTSQQYNGKINEWTLWCEQKKFSDGRLVKPNKLLLWLREVVLPRGNRKKRDTEGNPVPLTVEGLEGYIKPIVDLWSQQKLLNILSKDAEHPRSSAIQTLLKSLEKSRDAHRRATFQDKGAGTLLEGYSPEEKAKLVDFWWLQESHHGEHLRNLAGFLLQNATMARGDNVRHMQLSDMWSKELEGEGPSMCIALGITSRQGKTNQVGRIEYTGAIRHREFNFCTIGAIAMYFFWRFQIQKEPPPDVKESRLWYDTFFMKVEEAQSKRRKVKKVQGLSDSLGDLPGCMSYDTQYQAYRKAYAAVGICATKVVHLPRGVAARQTTQNGVQAEQTNMMGGWARDIKSLSYANDLAREAMRDLGGWPKEGKGFFLPRACETPNEELQRKVFPWLEQQTANGAGCIAGKRFLELMRYLRVVLLQDAVFWKKRHPLHPLFRNEIFQSKQFTEWASVLEASTSIAQNPTHKQIDQVAPIIAEAIGLAMNTISTSLAAQKETFNQQLGRMEISIARIHHSHVRSSQQLRSIIAAFQSSQEAGANAFANALETIVDQPILEFGENEEIQTPDAVANDDLDVAIPLPQAEVVAVPPKYSPRRDLTSIEEVWREYEYGFPPNPSVKSLEKTWKRKWRLNLADDKYFSRQKIIYKAIERVSQQEEKTEMEIAKRFDEERIQMGLTVDKFRFYLKAK